MDELFALLRHLTREPFLAQTGVELGGNGQELLADGHQEIGQREYQLFRVWVVFFKLNRCYKRAPRLIHNRPGAGAPRECLGQVILRMMLLLFLDDINPTCAFLRSDLDFMRLGGRVQ